MFFKRTDYKNYIKSLKVLLFAAVSVFTAAFVSACGNRSEIQTSPLVNDVTKDSEAVTKPTVMETVTNPTHTDESGRPIINFYLSKTAGREDRTLCTSVTSTWTAKKDIVVLEPLAYEQERHVGSVSAYASFWRELWNSFPNADKCKLGYSMDITLNDNTIVHKTVTKPSDTESFYNYVEMYIYDDVNQKPNTWYSHLLDSQITENTLMTSIKLTAGSDISLVKTISVSVFVYSDSNDFDKNGDFTGTHKSTAVLRQP